MVVASNIDFAEIVGYRILSTPQILCLKAIDVYFIVVLVFVFAFLETYTADTIFYNANLMPMTFQMKEIT